MLNNTQLANEIINLTPKETLLKLNEIYFASFLIVLAIIFFLSLLLGILLIKRNWGIFFAIFLIPQLIAWAVFLLLIIFFPIIPEITANLFKGVLLK